MISKANMKGRASSRPIFLLEGSGLNIRHLLSTCQLMVKVDKVQRMGSNVLSELIFRCQGSETSTRNHYSITPLLQYVLTDTYQLRTSLLTLTPIL